MAIDRIAAIKELKHKHQKNTIDWGDYFEDIIGVTKPTGNEPEKIVLHFDGKTGKYVETKPLHGSRKSKWVTTNTLEVKLHLIINYELEQMILSYADSVKVVEPKSLANSVFKRMSEALNHYREK